MSMRTIIRKRMDKNRDHFISFVEMDKTFDRVKRGVIFEVLKKIGVMFRDRRIICD